MRVLVTLDGSQLAERALASIAPWAKEWGAEVWLLSVLDPGDESDTLEPGERREALSPGYDTAQALRGVPKEPYRRLVENRGQALESARISAEEELIDKAAAYLEGLRPEVHVVFAGDVARAISAFAEDNAIDFIAMSSHGRSGLGQAVFGSVASAVMHRSTIPVILVGTHVPAVLSGRPAEPARATVSGGVAAVGTGSA